MRERFLASWQSQTESPASMSRAGGGGGLGCLETLLQSEDCLQVAKKARVFPDG